MVFRPSRRKLFGAERIFSALYKDAADLLCVFAVAVRKDRENSFNFTIDGYPLTFVAVRKDRENSFSFVMALTSHFLGRGPQGPRE